MQGFDTHNNHGGAAGRANLQRCIGWAIHALPSISRAGDKCTWDNLVVVTLNSRTTVRTQWNRHAEAGAMFVSGGSIKVGWWGAAPPTRCPGSLDRRIRGAEQMVRCSLLATAT
jgi:uncharacterized protein (DUF1501 family)